MLWGISIRIWDGGRIVILGVLYSTVDVDIDKEAMEMNVWGMWEYTKSTRHWYL